MGVLWATLLGDAHGGSSPASGSPPPPKGSKTRLVCSPELCGHSRGCPGRVWSVQGLWCYPCPAGAGQPPDLFSFSIPLIAQDTSGLQKTNRYPQLTSVPGLNCSPLTNFSSRSFPPYPPSPPQPPQRETQTKNSCREGKGACGLCG